MSPSLEQRINRISARPMISSSACGPCEPEHLGLRGSWATRVRSRGCRGPGGTMLQQVTSLVWPLAWSLRCPLPRPRTALDATLGRALAGLMPNAPDSGPAGPCWPRDGSLDRG